MTGINLKTTGKIFQQGWLIRIMSAVFLQCACCKRDKAVESVPRPSAFYFDADLILCQSNS
ncbi:MAG: hypothetical protein CRN43_00640 [Candidatus Nephrothrix sp. EaCA]|nr:MAG: hypothetical protein CRN43_00640 [Candidatus Nephrothrix sp. EaCA]